MFFLACFILTSYFGVQKIIINLIYILCLQKKLLKDLKKKGLRQLL